MAMKPWCYWSLGVVGDGTSTSVTFNLLTDPFALGAAGAQGGGVTLGFTFTVSLSNLPSALTVISCSDGQTVTPTLGMGGAVTFSWPVAIPANTEVTMYGALEF